jgi:hypothetical protein
MPERLGAFAWKGNPVGEKRAGYFGDGTVMAEVK